MDQKTDSNNIIDKCYNCDKPAIKKLGDKSLCLDCYHKIIQIELIEQQIQHNKMSWASSHLNFIEQQLYISSGGLLPLKQMMIPSPPTVPNYSFQQIKITDSNIGVINTGTLFNLDTSIQVIQSRGDKDLAKAVQELTQAVLDSKDINNELQKEIVEQLELLVTEALASKEKQRKSLAKKVIESISQTISTTASLLTIWNTLRPLLQGYLGL